jgi:hypothetical protein
MSQVSPLYATSLQVSLQSQPDCITATPCRPLFLDALPARQSDQDSSRQAIYFGIGLVAQKTLTKGLSINYLGYLLGAEQARRSMGLGMVIQLVADQLALDDRPDLKDDVTTMSSRIVGQSMSIADRMGLGGNYRVMLASDMQHEEGFHENNEHVRTYLSDKGLPGPVENYTRLQLAITRQMQDRYNVTTKLSWAVSGADGKFDERFFDNHYAGMDGNRLTCVYSHAGRTLDPARPRVSPYFVHSPENHLLLSIEDDWQQKWDMLQQNKGRITTAVKEHVEMIVGNYEDMIAPLHGTDTGQKLGSLQRAIL